MPRLIRDMVSMLPFRSRRAKLLVSVCAILPLNLAAEAKLSRVLTAAENEIHTVHEFPITPDDRSHWSFQPLRRPALPATGDLAWTKNSIDSFILAKQRENGLQPLPPADRATVLRRVAYDLTGLPPTPQQIDEFLSDRSSDAYDRLVDRLLGSHHYGERWAQHWLDLARFAETDGYEFDKPRSNAWRYRDWVVDALNADMPYGRFVQLQLAGDELEPGDTHAALATAFCMSGPDMPDINSQEERRQSLLNEMTATIGSSLLGLQIGCAQCHDHKYDPISQADFYRLRAVFAPAVHVEKDISVDVLSEDANDVPVSYLMVRGDWRRPGAKVEPAFPRIANPWNEQVPSQDSASPTTGRRSSLARWLTRGDHPLSTRVIVNRIWQHHFGHGLCRTPSDFGTMGEEPSHPGLLDWLATELVRRGWSLKQMHRLIVTSATYRQASRPESDGWSSQQQATARDRWQTSLRVDPDNFWLARFPRRRLEGEAIRDAMLASAGMLSSRRGGPGSRPPLPKELVGTLLKNQWNESSDPEDHYRRSVYVFARRNLRYPIFEAFDRPDANLTCARRSLSTTAPQSLLMLNSDFSLTVARHLAGRVLTHTRDIQGDAVRLAFLRTLNRRPVIGESNAAARFMESQRKRLQDEARQSEQLALPSPCPQEVDPFSAAAVTDLCLALLNSNEFVYVD